MNKQEVAAAAHQLLGLAALEVTPLGGDAHRVDLAGGGRVVIKGHGRPDAVRAEAASLVWLAGAGTVPVPKLRAQNARWLVTDLVPTGAPGPMAAENLGRGLALMHAAGAQSFGSPPEGGPAEASIGSALMLNLPAETWPAFYAQYRIEPYLAICVDRNLIGPAQAKIFRRVIEGIDDLAGEPEPPARLHGDLWNGNVLWGADGCAWLIDPAAHGGHRETDLAMLRLFGCPHLDHVLGAYNDEAPLMDGWKIRVPLHQIFPLLVHAVLFGGAYAEQAVRAAQDSLRG